jgi:hypothetical protein
MIQEKAHYGRIGGIFHSAIHGVATLIIVLIFTGNLWLAISMSIIDSTVHYHIDWFKSQISKKYSISDRAFWNWLGADQMIHSLTYVLIVYLIIQYY